LDRSFLEILCPEKNDSFGNRNCRGWTKRRRPDSNRRWRICNPTTCPENPDKNVGFAAGGSISAAVAGKTAHDDPDLQALIDAWPGLPEAVKAGILAMVTTSRDRAEG
jgi:hypothetical protein